MFNGVGVFLRGGLVTSYFQSLITSLINLLNMVHASVLTMHSRMEVLTLHN